MVTTEVTTKLIPAGPCALPASPQTILPTASRAEMSPHYTPGFKTLNFTTAEDSS